MAIQPRHAEEHFRQTGKFKPISDHQCSSQRSPNKFIIQSFQRLATNAFIGISEGARLWRVYLEETIFNTSEQSLRQLIISAFECLQRSGNLIDGTELFVNVGGVLIQKLRQREEKFCLSYLDYSCAIVRLVQSNEQLFLDLYLFDSRPPPDRDFTEEITIKLKQDPQSFFLVQRSKMLYIVKNLLKNYPILDITDHNLEQTNAQVERQSLLIKNLSARIIAVKFQQQNFSKSNEPLLIVINNREVYHQILFKINRIKFMKYRPEDTDIKDWHSFDNNPQHLKKESKTTPDKTKQKPNKVSILSTNAVEESKQSENKKKITLINQPRHLKISQRVATNPKESNLVPSQVEYSVSVKDEKQKENPYFDEFQNLLYEQEGGEEKQLALNDSFQEFEKKEHSQKNLEIMKQLNKRKEKETEQKRMLDSLKQKLKELMAEEKEWINKNLKLKLDIKRLKNPETPEQNKEIDEIKAKIGELKIQEHLLMEQLTQIKKNNCIETLVFCDGIPQESSQSQRGKDNKIFHSINNLPLQSSNFNPLTTSVRSNAPAAKFPQPMMAPQIPPPELSSNNHPPPFKQSFRSNFPGVHSPQANTINLYSSIPTQSLIQQNYVPNNQSKTPPILVSSNEYTGFPRPNAHNHQNSVAFTSAIFASGGRLGVGSPLGAKKASYQVFPSANNNKN